MCHGVNGNCIRIQLASVSVHACVVNVGVQWQPMRPMEGNKATRGHRLFPGRWFHLVEIMHVTAHCTARLYMTRREHWVGMYVAEMMPLVFVVPGGYSRVHDHDDEHRLARGEC
jgi:hypothetical protein